MVRLALLFAFAVLAPELHSLGSPPAPDKYDEEIRRRWRARLAELEELQKRTRISLSGASLADLGRAGFIFEEAGGIARRPPHEFDRNCVYAAVDGQSDREIEESLASMVNYLRLSAVARAMALSARRRQPLIGPRKGMELIVQTERAVEEFRERQAERVRAGAIPAAYVFTRANLGELGHLSTYRALWRAYREGERHYALQNDLAAFIVFFGSLGILSAIALVHLRRLAARHRYLTLLAQE